MRRTKEYLHNLANMIIKETLEDKAEEVMEKIKYGKLKNAPTEFDYVAEGETCEQCGGEMKEGDCMECGMRESEVLEKLHGNQKRLDKAPPYGKLTSADFQKLRKEKNEGSEVIYELELDEGDVCEQCGSKELYEGECVECGYMKGDMMEIGSSQNFTGGMFEEEEEVEEGNAFTGMLKKTKKGDKFKMNGKEYTDNSSLDETIYRLKDGENSALFTESEIIDLIESIVNEQKTKEKDNIKKGTLHKGAAVYEKAHKGSGKENEDYLKSVAKKMVDYIKDGSKGKYETNPKFFPKGNGQLEKMAAKKYTMSDDGNEFLNDFMRPGMENLDYDEIQPDEDWMKDNIEGSARTGNNPEWANAEETELGEKINKKRKANKYAQAKRTAYRKSKQPVTDGTGENSGKGVDIKLESVNEKEKLKLNEEFDRIKNLMGYSQKTQ
jgi:hypothetical protein